MGDARHNPKSTQYRAPANFPEKILGGGIIALERPSDAWSKAHQGLPGAKPSPADMTVTWFLVGTWCVTSQLLPQDKWPVGTLPLAQVHQMPLMEFRQMMVDAGLPIPEPTAEVQLVGD